MAIIHFKMLSDLEEKYGKGLLEENDETPLDMCWIR